MNRNKSIICQVKRMGLVGKHAGSKPIKRLIRLIGQCDSAFYWHRKAAENKVSR